MYWKLNEDYSLRGFADAPRRVLRASDGRAFPMDAEDFACLAACDGETNLPPSPRLFALEKRGFITSLNAPASLRASQRMVLYKNAYFRSLNLAVTGRCNFACRHCFMAKDSGAVTGEFTFEQIERLLDECVQCGITRVSLTGGEPFLRGDFGDVLRAVSARGLTLENITTNGSLVKEDVLSLMRKLDQRPLMRVSFDGLGWHDWMRGVPGAETMALDAISRLCRDGFPVLAQMCVHRGNLAAMRPTAQRMAEMGVKELRIIRTGEAPRWKEHSDGNGLPPEEYFEAALSFLAWYVAEDLPMDLAVWGFVRYFHKNRRFHCLPVRCPTGECSEEEPLCADAQREVFIGYDGEAAPCNQISGTLAARNIRLGNVLENGLPSLLTESDFLRSAKLPVRALASANAECRECPFFRYCLGGCRAMALANSGDELGPDRMSCIFFKKGYWRRLHDVIKQNRPKGGAV